MRNGNGCDKMEKIIITALVAGVSAYLGYRFKLPAGCLLGSLIGVSAYSIITGNALMPTDVKTVVQMVAGAFIGLGVSKKDVQEMRFLFKPMLVLIACLLVMNLSVGFLLHKMAGMTLITGLLCSAPGGVMDISMMSGSLGGDEGTVAVMQSVRVMTVVGIFPIFFRMMQAHFDPDRAALAAGQAKAKTAKKKGGPKEILITLAITFASGTVGAISGVPAGALSFAMAGVAAYNIMGGHSYMPPVYKKIAQTFAGAVIGAGMTMADFLSLRTLLLPAVIMMVAYFITDTVATFLMLKVSNVDFTSAMFAASPGGISDMALIAMDMGGDSPRIAVLQLGRMLAVVAVFPFIYQFFISLL